MNTPACTAATASSLTQRASAMSSVPPEGMEDETMAAWRAERARNHEDILGDMAALRHESATLGPDRASTAVAVSPGAVGVLPRLDEVLAAAATATPAVVGPHHAAPEVEDARADNTAGADAGAVSGPPLLPLTEGLQLGADESVPGGPAPTNEVEVPAPAPMQVPPDAGNARQSAPPRSAPVGRAWCARLCIAAGMQGIVQFLTGRVCLQEVALWRMQTASCAWSGHSVSGEAHDETAQAGEPGSIRPLVIWSSFGAVLHSGWAVSSQRGGGAEWLCVRPDAATVAARRNWSSDLHDEAFEVVAANSFIWNRALRPIIGVGLAQLLCAHCPRQLWAKTLLLAIPFLHHPLKVVSLRLVCPGWPPASFLHLLLHSLDGTSKTSAMAGILPKLCSHVLTVSLRKLRLHEKLGESIVRMWPATAAPAAPAAPAGPGRGAAAEAGAGERGGDTALRAAESGQRESGERAAAVAPDTRAGPLSHARAALREMFGHLRAPQRLRHHLGTVVGGMAEELILASVTYPLVVLERRMCVDANAPANALSLRANLGYIYTLIQVEGWSALVEAYLDAMEVAVHKFAIRIIQHCVEHIALAWFGPFGRLTLPAASAALATGGNALRMMGHSHVKRAPWNSLLSIVLWMECGALAACYKQLGQHASLGEHTQRLRFWGMGGGSSAEGRTRGLRLPLVRFRSDEARAQWFATAYGFAAAGVPATHAGTNADTDTVGAPSITAGIDSGALAAAADTAGTDGAAAVAAPGDDARGQAAATDAAAAQRAEEAGHGASAEMAASRHSARTFRLLGPPHVWQGGEARMREEEAGGLTSGQAARAILRKGKAGGLRTIVSEPAAIDSTRQEDLQSKTPMDLARKTWKLRSQLRSPDFAHNLPLSLVIDPNDVLGSTFALLEALPAEVLVSRPLFVRFEGQIGSDWGGVRRTWMARLAQELFDPRLGLVIPCSLLSASHGAQPTGTLAINPAPELLYSDQTMSKSRCVREDKRQEKRDHLRAQLEGDRCRHHAREDERSCRRADTGVECVAAETGAECADAEVVGRASSGSEGQDGGAVSLETHRASAVAEAAADHRVLDAASVTDRGDGGDRIGRGTADPGPGEDASESEIDPCSLRVPAVNAQRALEGSAVTGARGHGRVRAVNEHADGTAAERPPTAGGEDDAEDGDPVAGNVDTEVPAEKESDVERWRESATKGTIKDKSLMDRYLRFLGRVLGVALVSGDPLGVNLDSAFFHLLLAREPLRIVLLGPPNCGKTLQCNLLTSRCRLRHVTLERLVRWHLTHNTREGKDLKKLLRSMSAKASSARFAAECLLLALHPPIPPAGEASMDSGSGPAVGASDVEIAGGDGSSSATTGGPGGARERLERDGSRGKVEERLYRKAQEIVLSMLKTRLAPRRRAGDKGWVLEGLPHCPALAGGLWDLGEHCRPHLVIALHPMPEGQPPNEGPPGSGAWHKKAKPLHAGENDGSAGAAHGDAVRAAAAVTQPVGDLAPENPKYAADPAFGHDDKMAATAGDVDPAVAEAEVQAPAAVQMIGWGDGVDGVEGARRRERATSWDSERAKAEGRRERAERINDYYRRHVWDILDFFHSRKVVCALINNAADPEAAADERRKADADGGVAECASMVASGEEERAATPTDTPNTLGEGHVPEAEWPGCLPGDCTRGEDDEASWTHVGAASVPNASVDAAAAGPGRRGRGSSGAEREAGLNGQGVAHAPARSAYYMSPPDLHREICRVVSLVRWGAAGVSEPGLEHMAQTDPDEYEKLQRLVSMGPEECQAWLGAADMPFTTMTKEARVAQILGLPLSSVDRIETAPLGGFTPHERVSPANVREYVELVSHRRMVEDVAAQMAQVRHGFEELVKHRVLNKFLTADELERVLLGSPDVDVGDWRCHSVAKGFAADSPQVGRDTSATYNILHAETPLSLHHTLIHLCCCAPQVEWFWQVLSEATAEVRLRILTWTTGLARAPLGGFAHMHLAFTLQCDAAPEHADRLPVAHTCGFQLDLPLYSTKEVLRGKLLQAVEHFDFHIA